jgi:hypothetical protein
MEECRIERKAGSDNLNEKHAALYTLLSFLWCREFCRTSEEEGRRSRVRRRRGEGRG